MWVGAESGGVESRGVERQAGERRWGEREWRGKRGRQEKGRWGAGSGNGERGEGSRGISDRQAKMALGFRSVTGRGRRTWVRHRLEGRGAEGWRRSCVLWLPRVPSRAVSCRTPHSTETNSPWLARAGCRTCRTQWRFNDGSVPGRAASNSDTFSLGRPSRDARLLAGAPEKSLVRLRIWAWISRPTTTRQSRPLWPRMTPGPRLFAMCTPK